MDRGKDILAHHFFGDYDRILKVVSFPRHKGHLHVSTQGQFTFFGSITFTKYLTFFHLVPFSYDWFQVDTGPLVCFSELHQLVGLRVIVKAYQPFFIGSIVLNGDLLCIHILNNSISFGIDQYSGIGSYLSFQTCTYDRRVWSQQWNCLTHHVRSHQRTVRIIVLQERNQRCGNGSNLVRRNVGIFYLCWVHNREITFFTGNYLLPFNGTVICT